MNWALVMAGGAGTRFWPASRLARPKQLLPVASAKSLIQETVNRIKPLIHPNQIIVLTQKKQINAIRKSLPEIPKSNFIVEPVGRNTAPAIAMGAFMALKRDPRATILCLPADQIVTKRKQFIKTILTGIRTAEKNDCHITFGIPPRSPETGFGYVERGIKIENVNGVPVYHVKRFVEKPGLSRAKKYLKSGNFYWNSGIFAWKAAFLLDSLKQEKPDLYRKLAQIAESFGKKDWENKINRIYPSCENISIDYALMEKAQDVRVLPGDFGWSDIGSWGAFEHIWPKDASRNSSPNKIVSIESFGNIVDGNSQLVALVGVKDLVVVTTSDAVLVARKDKVQDVRKVIEVLKSKGLNQYL